MYGKNIVIMPMEKSCICTRDKAGEERLKGGLRFGLLVVRNSILKLVANWSYVFVYLEFTWE